MAFFVEIKYVYNTVAIADTVLISVGSLMFLNSILVNVIRTLPSTILQVMVPDVALYDLLSTDKIGLLVPAPPAALTVKVLPSAGVALPYRLTTTLAVGDKQVATIP